MSTGSCRRNTWKLVTVSLFLAQISGGQDQALMLRLQRSRASSNSNATGGMEARGRNIMSLGQGMGGSMGVSSYPNSASCLLVYSDGKYILEKRDEQTLGKPKVKTAEGTLAGDDLQQLRAILDNDELKKIANVKAPEVPLGAQGLREAETLDVQINRNGAMQQFTTIKERLKTQAIGSSAVSTAPSTGMDTYLDNGTPYKKTLNPLIKWLEGLEKNSKKSLKESKPQYCVPMNIG